MCNLSASILETGREEGFEMGFEEGHEEGFEEGFEKAKRENVLSLASAGFSAEEISGFLKVDIVKVRTWIKH